MTENCAESRTSPKFDWSSRTTTGLSCGAIPNEFILSQNHFCATFCAGSICDPGKGCFNTTKMLLSAPCRSAPCSSRFQVRIYQIKPPRWSTVRLSSQLPKTRLYSTPRSWAGLACKHCDKTELVSVSLWIRTICSSLNRARFISSLTALRDNCS